MSQTRRLAAILAADVAGYSQLMGADEEGTLERPARWKPTNATRAPALGPRGLCRAAAQRTQRRFRFPRQDPHQRDRRRLHCHPVLFPIPQGGDWNTQRFGKLSLRHAQFFANVPWRDDLVLGELLVRPFSVFDHLTAYLLLCGRLDPGSIAFRRKRLDLIGRHFCDSHSCASFRLARRTEMICSTLPRHVNAT